MVPFVISVISTGLWTDDSALIHSYNHSVNFQLARTHFASNSFQLLALCEEFVWWMYFLQKNLLHLHYQVIYSFNKNKQFPNIPEGHQWYSPFKVEQSVQLSCLLSYFILSLINFSESKQETKPINLWRILHKIMFKRML